MSLFKQLKKYPIVLVFFLVLGGFFIADILATDKAVSELENRPLSQAPAFNWDSLVQNQWTKDYGNYMRDQFPLRDEWISTWSIFETLQGKLEDGGVWFADDGYQIAKDDVWSDSQAQRTAINTDAVTELAQRHPGEVSVMIVPSPANTLTDRLPWNPPQIDEDALLDDMFARWRTADANVIDLRPAFEAADADGTQLYYRTDHHWTTEGGAWVAYREFCLSRGRDPVAPGAARVDVDDFFGTNFSKTKRFGTQADTLVYYDYDNPLTVYSMQEDGTYAGESGPLMDTSRLSTYDKYSAFLRGNNGYSVLEGNGEGSILIIKDSYGNCFVPYLIENYAQIGIIDLRAWRNVDDVYAEGGYDEILVLYNFPTFSTDMYANRMGTQFNTGE